jgi:CDP-ribitol ribitolphosphotransferase / teichoic acid ribitol-phosphate polymerase
MSISCSVTSISWERVNLSLTVSLSKPATMSDDVQFYLVDRHREFPVRQKHVGDDLYQLNINVTNFHNRKQVPDGTWRVVPYIDGAPELAATYDLNDLEQLSHDSRTFIYANNRVSYIVAFGVSEDDERPVLLLKTYQMFRSPKRSKGSPKPPLIRRITKRILRRSQRIRFANRWYRLSRLLQPPKGNRILFASEMRTSMEGNLLRIHERMVERGLDSTFEFRYSFRIPRTSTGWNTARLIHLIATSDIVLIDDYFSLLETLRVAPETKIIQAWHAGSGFKSIGYSRFGNYGSPKLQNAHRKYTYAITGSKHLVPVYAEAFGIEESAVIPTGLPRIDTFLDPARAEKVKAEFAAMYPQLRDKRIILLAPTFRGRGSETAHYDYSKIDFEKLYDACGDDTVVLFRMHHFVLEPVPIPPQLGGRLLDFTSFPETNDLLHVTDVLITDYSSIIYEFALLDRPMLFFAYDRDVYSATRGFHRDYEETAPGKVCEAFDDLVKAIQEKDYDTWKIEAFRRENFDIVDTHSADRVIDQLILGDPSSARPRASELAEQDPSVGETAIGDGTLSGPHDEA